MGFAWPIEQEHEHCVFLAVNEVHTAGTSGLPPALAKFSGGEISPAPRCHNVTPSFLVVRSRARPFRRMVTIKAWSRVLLSVGTGRRHD